MSYMYSSFPLQGSPRVNVGLYAIFIENVFSIFPRKNIFVNNLDVYTRDRVEAFESLYSFMGLGELNKSGPWFNIKTSSIQYRKSHCGDVTVVRLSHLHNGISYTGKMSSLYWIGPWWVESPCVWVFTRGQFWPPGIAVVCACRCVRVSMCVSVCQSLACPRDNSGHVQARITKIGPKMQTPWLRSLLFWGQSILTFKVKFNLKSQNLPHFPLVRTS